MMSALFAATNDRTVFPSLLNGVGKFNSINDFAIVIANIIQILLALSAILAIIFIIWSGLQFAASSGDPGRVKDARNGITNAIVGLIICSGAYLLVDFFARQFG